VVLNVEHRLRVSAHGDQNPCYTRPDIAIAFRAIEFPHVNPVHEFTTSRIFKRPALIAGSRRHTTGISVGELPP